MMSLRDVWPGVPRTTPSPPATESPREPEPWLCPATGKVRHATKALALGQLASLVKENPDEILNTYQCRHCGNWHVGHR